MINYGTIYRLEFTNIKGQTIRINISPTDFIISSGTISPASVLFVLSGGDNFITIFDSGFHDFFYVGQVFSVTGSASNNTTFTVESFTVSGGKPTAKVTETVSTEAVAATLTDTNIITIPEVIPIKGTGQPLVISTINNDQEKFQTIKSKQATIQFVSDSANGIDINTFSKGADDLWKVDILLQGTGETIFTGFLILADNQQPFQPDPNAVTLTATDHLGILKDIPLVNYSDQNPTGKYRIVDLITMCLRKTGLSLDLHVVNNLRTGGGQLTQGVTFITSPLNEFFTSVTNYFYPGQEIIITGTPSNDGTYHVKSVGQGALTFVELVETITAETAPGAAFEDTASSKHFYDAVYLDAKTFEKQIGESEDCYSVLSKILGEDCFITQWKGSWYIMRIDEFDSNPIYEAIFFTDGILNTIGSGTTRNKKIGNYPGAAEDIKFANADTLLQLIRPHGFVKETFNFINPLELVCNSDFSRGDLITTISPTEKDYNLDCWTKRRGGPGAYNFIGPTTITDFIKRIFNVNDYEIDRYIYITAQTGHGFISSTDDEYIESEPMAIQQGDKVEASVDWRFDRNISSSSGNIPLMRVVIFGEDGTTWLLGEETIGDGIPKWFQASFTTGFNSNKGYKAIFFADQDETEWQSQTWTSPPAPVSGDLHIWLNNARAIDAVPAGTLVYYSNLRLDYIPLINGTYAKFSGQYERVDRLSLGYLAKRDNEVFITDGPNKTTKGSMFFLAGGTYRLTRNWYTAAPLALALNTDPSFLHPYGFMQVFSVWNQFRGTDDPQGRGRGINIFTGTVYGLDDGLSDWPDLIHKYVLTDINESTNDRYFMLLQMSQDWNSCLWQATLAEVFNFVLGKVYTDTHSFKYIAE